MDVIYLEPPSTGGGELARSYQGPVDGPYSRVAIGAFDGVHLGHQRVLSGCDTVLTFDPHPMSVLDPNRVPRLLSDHKTKVRKLEVLGIQRVAIICFNEAWSRLSPHQFVEHVLLIGLGAGFVSVGENFRFGAGGAGTPKTFEAYPSLQFQVVPLLPHGQSGDPISSTRIRNLVATGNVEAAAELLGGPLVVPARVSFESRLVISEKLALPAPGLYLGLVNNRSTAITVCSGNMVHVARNIRQGSDVELSFVERVDRTFSRRAVCCRHRRSG